MHAQTNPAWRTAFGLLIYSDVELPELAPAFPGPPDLTIRVGAVPPALPAGAIIAHGVCFSMTAEQTIIHIPGIARYWVRSGSQIAVDPEPGADDDSVRLFLTTSVLAAALYQRSLCPISGCAIATDRGAILVCGPSSAGKSTLAAALLARGHRLLSDDLCVLTAAPTGGSMLVLPGLPRLLLWEQALHRLRQIAEAATPARPNLKLSSVLIPGRSCAEATPLWRIYALRTGNAAESAITDLNGARKFNALQSRLPFHSRIRNGSPNRATAFRWLTAVCSAAPARAISRSVLDRPESVASLLEEDMRP